MITKNEKPVVLLAPEAGASKHRRPVFGMHKGRVYPIGDVNLDEPVVPPETWTADEENVAPKE